MVLLLNWSLFIFTALFWAKPLTDNEQIKRDRKNIFLGILNFWDKLSSYYNSINGNTTLSAARAIKKLKQCKAAFRCPTFVLYMEKRKMHLPFTRTLGSLFLKKNNHVFDLEETLAGCRRHKSSAQKRLFEYFLGYAKSIASRYASNSDEVQEMVNDGFLKIFAKIDKYDADKSFKAWFKTVMVRTCIDYYRKHHAKVSFLDINEVHYLAYDEDLIAQLSAKEILELVQKMPSSYRIVFSMFVVEGYSHVEIAKHLGIKESTSRSNLVKAKMKMKEMVKVYLT